MADVGLRRLNPRQVFLQSHRLSLNLASEDSRVFHLLMNSPMFGVHVQTSKRRSGTEAGNGPLPRRSERGQLFACDAQAARLKGSSLSLT